VCCDQLLCARCAAPVSLGRCEVCRMARAELHGSAGPSMALLVTAVLAVLVVAAALQAALLH